MENERGNTHDNTALLLGKTDGCNGCEKDKEKQNCSYVFNEEII
ncbi:MAG: hypothetical protein AB1798_05435 [Spirochaetota bacterium]